MRPPVLAAIAIALLASAAPAAAAPRLHGIPARVRSGTALRITWTGLGPEAHEAELELSLAGGRWVRISPELEAREGGFTWPVPAGLAGPARVRLKYGGEWFEAEGDVSTPFVLEPGEGVSMARAREAGFGEWWGLGRGSGTRPLPQVEGTASFHRPGPVLALSSEPDRMARLACSTAARSSIRASARIRGERAPHRGDLVRTCPLRI